MIGDHDKRRIYCSGLGMVVEFGHCRAAGPPIDGRQGSGRAERLPCQRLLGCWHSRLDVGAFVVENYTEEEARAFLAPRATRMDRMYAAASTAGDGDRT